MKIEYSNDDEKEGWMRRKESGRMKTWERKKEKEQKGRKGKANEEKIVKQMGN